MLKSAIDSNQDMMLGGSRDRPFSQNKLILPLFATPFCIGNLCKCMISICILTFLECVMGITISFPDTFKVDNEGFERFLDAKYLYVFFVLSTEKCKCVLKVFQS